MEHVGIKILHTAAGGGLFKIAEAVIKTFRHVAGQFRGQFKSIPGVAGGEGFADGDLAFTVQIGVGGVKAPAAQSEKIVHHFVQYVVIDLIIFVGQPQESETQLVHKRSSRFFFI